MTTFSEKPAVLEACVASVADAVAAAQSGADRLELNVGIELGGLTPTVGLLEQVKDAVDLPVLVMLRPRAGGFCYSALEKRVMVRDAHVFMERGADGVVIGALAENGLIDHELIERIREVCQERELVFHRAFDLLRKQSEGLEKLIELDVDRVLTSGGEASALAGAGGILELVKIANGRISILPGGGVRAATVVEMLQKTGCTQVHGTFKVLKTDPAGNVCEGSFPVVDPDEVKAVRYVLDRYCSDRH
ncbi:MAG: copper homeostasis protein CutC [Rhodopirellula sp.]|nr:copper homeostasis protein CutC [Rhodopirellula sp.]